MRGECQAIRVLGATAQFLQLNKSFIFSEIRVDMVCLCILRIENRILPRVALMRLTTIFGMFFGLILSAIPLGATN